MKEIKPQEVIMLITPLRKVRDDGEAHSVRCSETFVQTLVRCKECKHRFTKDCPLRFDYAPFNDDWFCADGKPKVACNDEESEK